MPIGHFLLWPKGDQSVYTHAMCSLLLAVRALIVDLRTEPDIPISDSNNNASCLLAGNEVEIVCENYAFPVGTVMFVKDSQVIETENDPRCVFRV